jgi:hypothetical protein
MRALRNILLAAVLGLSLPACITPYTPWPDEATGGLAEKEAAFDPELESLKKRYTALQDVKAETRFPALMLEAQRLIVRASRERAGALVIDSSRTAAEVSSLLAQLEARLGLKPSAVAQKVRR